VHDIVTGAPLPHMPLCLGWKFEFSIISPGNLCLTEDTLHIGERLSFTASVAANEPRHLKKTLRAIEGVGKDGATIGVRIPDRRGR
jgi:hypothetical protein